MRAGTVIKATIATVTMIVVLSTTTVATVDVTLAIICKTLIHDSVTSSCQALC